jgi:hypothetical protein
MADNPSTATEIKDRDKVKSRSEALVTLSCCYLIIIGKKTLFAITVKNCQL